MSCDCSPASKQNQGKAFGSGVLNGFLLTALLINRILFLVLRAALGVILLAKVNFKTTWYAQYSYPISLGGVPPIDPSLQQIPNWAQRASNVVMNVWPSILVDPTIVTPVPPYVCSGSDCISLFCPGGTGAVANNSVWDKKTYAQATAIVLNDAPGYQIEFTALTNVPPDPTAVCHSYATSSLGIQICIQTDGSQIIAGNSLPT